MQHRFFSSIILLLVLNLLAVGCHVVSEYRAELESQDAPMNGPQSGDKQSDPSNTSSSAPVPSETPNGLAAEISVTVDQGNSEATTGQDNSGATETPSTATEEDSSETALIEEAAESDSESFNPPSDEGPQDSNPEEPAAEREEETTVSEIGDTDKDEPDETSETLVFYKSSTKGPTTYCKQAPPLANDIVKVAYGEWQRNVHETLRKSGQTDTDSDKGGRVDMYQDYPYSPSKWCSEFVSWVYKAADVPFSDSGWFDPWRLTTSEKIVDWFNDHHNFYKDLATANVQPGDYITFDWNADGETDHSALVFGVVQESDGSESLWTIEGNIDDIDYYGTEYYGTDGVEIVCRPNFRTNYGQKYLGYPTQKITSAGSYSIYGFGMRHSTGGNIAPYGDASASSSGDNRGPSKAIDLKKDTWWRNRTDQISDEQWLKIEFNNDKKIKKVRIYFGNHYPKKYKLQVYKNLVWNSTQMLTCTDSTCNNKNQTITFSQVQKTDAIRIRSYEYSQDDYYSIYEFEVYEE